MFIFLTFLFAATAITLVFAATSENITRRAASLLNRYAGVTAILGTITAFNI